ncbi:MAG TPA: LPS export ABC transporter periplasmic protein LptC [Xylella taiwanensis]
MSWRSILNIMLLIAAIVSGWSAWHQRKHMQATSPQDITTDYTLHDFKMVALDKQTGKESLTLRAPQMQHNHTDSTAEVTTPLFMIPDKSGQHWTLHAQTGWLNKDGTLLRLRQDVKGDSPTDPGQVPTTFRTQSLDVYPNHHLAKTADTVTMTHQGIIQTGVGFEVNTKTQQYKLLSKVNTRYEPSAAH